MAFTAPRSAVSWTRSEAPVLRRYLAVSGPVTGCVLDLRHFVEEEAACIRWELERHDVLVHAGDEVRERDALGDFERVDSWV